MKIRWFGRDFEINKNRINVNNFKKEKILIGTNFNKKQMDLKQWKKLFLYLVMPYSWLNYRFMKNKMKK